jgi:elongation factor P
MDLETYDQHEIEGDLYEDIKGYLLDGSEVTLGVFNDQVVTLEVPQVVELKVAETAPAIRNSTATAQTKEATLETGITIQVPGYLESDEIIKVDTREGRFVSRA